MADPLIINPTLTQAGQQAALAASNQGVSLNLTHISYGMGKYAPVGNEVALKTPVSIKVSLAGGTRPTPYQLRMLSAWRENIGGEKAITEIGFWAGTVLAFIWSTAAGQAAFTKTDGVTAVHFIDLALSSVPASSISITIDPQEAVSLAAIAAHEGASNAHPDYVKHSLFPDAQADLWAEVVGGSANAIALTMPAEVVLNAYRKGQVFRFMSSYANTSTVTMNVNGLGVKPVVKSGGNALIPSDLKANSVYDVVYDGTRFQLNGGVGGGQFYIEYPTAAATAKQVAYQGTYTPGSMMVFVGGAKLPQSGFTATDGQNVTLTAASAAGIVVGTVVTIVALSTFAVADTYTKGEYQSFAATQAQAQDIASAVLDRWMSPQRVREAITARIQASAYDGAVSRLLVPGSFGLGGLTLPAYANINTLTVSGIYGWGAATVGRPVDGEAGEVIHMVGDTAAYASQLVTSHLSGRTWFRRKSNNVWSQVEIYHSGNQLALGTTAATARTALELGTAAGADVTTGEQDATLGRVLRVGDFGLGRTDLTDLSIDLNTLVATGFYFAGSAATNAPAGGISGMLIVLTNASNNTQQLFMTQGSTRFYQRSSAAGVWSQWVESWHTGNLAKTTSNSDTTIGNLLKVGDFGIGSKLLLTNNVVANVDDATLGNGMYAVSNATTGTKPATYGILLQEGRQNVAGTLGRVSQTFIDVDQPTAPRIYHRVYVYATSVWSAWVEDWNSSNLFKTTNAMDVTPGAVTRVGDFGLGVTQTMGANAITTGTDLNNLIVSGLYGQAQNVQATLALNYPVAKAGTLLVQRGGSQIVTQTYQEYDTGRQWSRGIYSGTPSAWVMSWDTGTLVKTTSTLDTTIGRMVQVGDFGLGTDASVKFTFASDTDWAKPAGWTGFIDLAASRTKGVTTPTAVGFTSNYGTWQILGRRDAGGGYMGTYTDYGTGRMWVGYATTNTAAPTFQEIYSRASVPAFMQTLLDDATQAEAQVTLGISNMINGITYKSVAGSSNVVLTAAEANVGIIILTGALTGNITVSVPAAFGLWNVLNRTSGAFTITFKTVAAASAGQLVLQGKQAQLFSDGTQIYYGATQFEAGYFRGEVITESTNSYRMVNNLFGSFWRQDSNALYLMLTNSGDPLGTYNALRPMSVNLTTGKVAMSSGLTVPTMADGAVTLDAANCLFVQNALAVYGLAQVSATETNLNTLRGTQFFGFSSSATGAVPGTNYDAVGFQIEAAGQRTQFAVAAGGLLYVRTDDSTNQAGFDPWVAQASQDYVAAQLAAYGVGTLTSTQITDYNAATTGGLFRAGTAATNAPPLSANYSVIVAPFNDGGCLQVATQLGGPSRSFTRTQAGGGWTAWRESLYSDAPVLSASPAASDMSKLVATMESVRGAMAAHGIGTADLNDQPSGVDLDTMRTGGFWQVNSALNGPPGYISGVLTVASNATYYTQQTFMPQGVNRMYQRSSNGQTAGFGAWREIASTDYVDAVDAKGVGEVSFYAMNTPPAGKFKCNGAAVSRTTYAALFAKLGTAYGTGDGSTTFNLPDMRGYFPRAWDDGRGVDSGRALGSTQASQNLSHGHTGTALSAGAHNHTTQFAREKILGAFTNDPNQGNAVLGDEVSDGYQPMVTDTYAAHTHTLSIAASGGSEARPVNVALLACIQY